MLEDGKIIIVRLWKQYVGEPAGAGQSVRKPGVWDTALDVRFFDGDLNLLRRKRIQVDPEAFQTLGMYAYGAEQDCLYFASRCVELKTHQCRPYPAGVKGNVLSVREIYTLRMGIPSMSWGRTGAFCHNTGSKAPESITM